MKVLLTGAFGNVGSSTLEELIARGHQVRCFDIETKSNRQAAKHFRDKVEIVWGDLRRPEDVAMAVAGQEVVLHLAFVIPTLSATGVGSEEDPAWAKAINVGGTRNVIAAAKAQPAPPKLLFTSSLHIYGRTHDQPPPRIVGDPPQPIEHYAHHKVECEQLVRASGLSWTIFRLGAALPIRLVLDPGMFGVPLDNRIEFVHSRDVATAIANALEEPRVWGQTWLIGGGPQCQLYEREIVEQVLESVGVGMLPEKAFTTVPFPTDWLDTAESQQLLRFQQRTLKDYTEDLRNRLGLRRPLVRLLRPIIRAWLLRQSPFLTKAGQNSEMTATRGVALVTGASSGIGAATARLLAKEGYEVVLVARRQERLSALRDEIGVNGGKAHIFTADLEQEGERRRLFADLKNTVGDVDILVNSAGLGWYGFGEEMPWNLARQMIEVNVAALTNLTLMFLADMKRRDQGHIINVSSIVGSLPSQGVALYSATKSFVDALTTSLYRELCGTNVHVSTVKPGAVATPFFESAASRANGLQIPAERLSIKPEVVANRIGSLIRRPRRVVYVPWALRFVPWIELAFGWLIDRVGPLLLKRQARHRIGA